MLEISVGIACKTLTARWLAPWSIFAMFCISARDGGVKLVGEDETPEGVAEGLCTANVVSVSK